MSSRPTIVIADEDHVIRLIRFALGDDAISTDWLKAFFAPENIPPEEVTAIAERLGLYRHCNLVTGQTGQEEELLGLCDQAQVIIFRRAAITRRVIERASQLRLIQRLGQRPIGIDLKAAAEHRVSVSCQPRPSLHRTAEHALLMMLAIGKKLIETDAALRTPGPEPTPNVTSKATRGGVAYNWLGTRPLRGLWGNTLGIVGLGEVGTLVAERARAFGMRVVYYKRSRLSSDEEEALGLEYQSFNDLLAESDFVSLHANATPETEHLFDARRFAQMRTGAIFVNVSRGALVDESALAEALERGHLGGAGLDTHETEPRQIDDRLAQRKDVILTPHLAGGSRLQLLDEVEELLANCARHLKSGSETAI